MKAIAAILALTSALLLWGAGQQQAAVKKMKVGTKPGNVKTSLDITQTKLQKGHELAMFAAGCFWGVEERFRQIPGVTATAVGFSGGRTEHPSYKQVCYENTRHAEVVLIEFDPAQISYEELVRIFYKNHDPRTLNRQGPDFGDQYRSAIFYANEGQKTIAERVTHELNASEFGGKIVTEITKASMFWMAEDYHQQYCEKNGIAACPIR